MSCWHILHISPTSDTRAIRRAYAKLLKTTRPDDDAAAYQALREAFDEAMAIAPYIDDDEEDDWPFAGEDGGADGFADTADTAAAVIRSMQDICRRAGGKGLLKLWPPLAARIAALDGHERGEVVRYLAGRLQQPAGLPKKLQKRWQKDYGLSAAQEYRERPSETEEADVFSNLFVLFVEEPEAGEKTQAQAAALFGQIDRWYDNGGIRPLLEHADEIEAAFAAFPLEDAAYLSHLCLQWLRRRHIRNPQLWVSWAEYFDWGKCSPSSSADLLDEDELENLAICRQNAAQAAPILPRGGESEAELAAQLAAQLENWFAQEGDQTLKECWPQTRELFNRFPLGSADRLSRQCAVFLHGRVTAPLVWQRWAQYFGWTADSFPDLFSDGERGLLAAVRDYAGSRQVTPPAHENGADGLFALLDGLTEEGGDAPARSLPHIENMLRALPSEEAAAVSDGLAALLRRKGLDSPQLWLFFANYFNWFAPSYRHLLPADEAAELEHWRRLEAQDFPAAAFLPLSWPEAVSADAADLIRRLCRSYWQGGSGGLLADWPQFAGEIENAGYEDCDTVTYFLVRWPQPQRLSRRLLHIWHAQYGVPLPDGSRNFAEPPAAAETEYGGYGADGFSDGRDFSDGPDGDAADILAFLENTHAIGGDGILAQQWPHIRAMLDKLPLGGADEISPHFADFLRRHHITHPLLWTQWADYFRWDEDVRCQIISAEESLRLADYRRTAELLADIGGESADILADGRQRPSTLPYTSAFALFLGQNPGFLRRFAAACAILVLWPETDRETDRSGRDAAAAFHPALYRLLHWGGEWRGAWLVTFLICCLTAAVWLAPEIGGDSLSFAVFTGILFGSCIIALTIFAYGLMLYLIGLVPPLERWTSTKWPDIKYHPKAAPLFLITLPALPAALAAAGFDADNPFTFYCFAASVFYYFPHCFGDRYAGSSWNWNWSISLLSISPAVTWLAFGLPDHWQLDAFTAAILWFNANMFLFFNRRERFEHIAAFIGRAARFQTASVPLRPFAAAAAGILWLLLLPACTARAAIGRQYGLILETAVLAAVLITPLPAAHPHGLLLFYPALLFTAWLRCLLTRAVLHGLQRHPAA